MFWQKFKRSQYKEPHNICAVYMALNTCMSLATYFDLERPFYLYAVIILLGAIPFYYLLYYLLASLLKNKGQTYSSLTYDHFKADTCTQNCAIVRQSMQDRVKWCAIAAAMIAFVLVWILFLSSETFINHVSIWIVLLILNILQVIVTFTLFAGFKKWFGLN